MPAPLVCTSSCHALIAAWIAAEDAWDAGGAKVDVALYSNDKTPAVGDAAADFDAVTVAGAALQAGLTASLAVLPDGRMAVVLADLPAFMATAEPDPEITAYGWLVTNHTSHDLIAAKRFANPVPIHDGTIVMASVVIPFPGRLQEREAEPLL